MWLEPKTDWQVSYDADGNYTGDYFNIEDYNRIKNNVKYLRKLALVLYIDFKYEEMGDDKFGYSDLPYASEFSLIESNLESIKNNSFAFYSANSKRWYGNMPTLNYQDLNRIESACLSMYDGLNKQLKSKDKLGIRLGYQRGAVKA